jgi:hypothetical protein
VRRRAHRHVDQQSFYDSRGLSSVIQSRQSAKRTESPPVEIRLVARTTDNEWQGYPLNIELRGKGPPDDPKLVFER